MAKQGQLQADDSQPDQKGRVAAQGAESDGGSILAISQRGDQCEQLIYAVTTSRD